MKISRIFHGTKAQTASVFAASNDIYVVSEDNNRRTFILLGPHFPVDDMTHAKRAAEYFKKAKSPQSDWERLLAQAIETTRQ